MPGKEALATDTGYQGTGRQMFIVLLGSWLMRTWSPHAQPCTRDSKSPPPPPGNHRKMGTASLRAGGQGRIVGWVPVTTATQVPLLKIDAGGVQSSLPGAAGSGRCRQGLLFQGSVLWEAWPLQCARTLPPEWCWSAGSPITMGSPFQRLTL